MKKYLINIPFFVIVFVLITTKSIAQEESATTPTSKINVLGRYLNKEKAVELIYFPDKKSTLYLGVKNGFIVERAELNDSIFTEEDIKFIKIKEVFPYTKPEWENAFSTSNENTKKELTLAKDFFDNIDKVEGSSISLGKGIRELKEAKSKEDFQYMIFVMNAIKDNKVAKALGLSFMDHTIKPNKKYVYRVKLVKESNLYKIESLLFEIETFNEEKQIKRKIYINPGDKQLTFIWDENDNVSGAFVERKNNTTGKFELLTENPILSSSNSGRNSYTDKNLSNYTKYEYRFYGMNPFGEKVYFGEEKGMTIDLTPPINPSITKLKQTSPGEVKIEWKMNVEELDLKGFVIARSDKNKGNFQLLHSKLLPKNTKAFTDKTFSKEKDNYYIVQAIDTAGNLSSSTPYMVTIIDSIPPVKPKFISGKIDSLGIVTLNIKLNKEKDLMGYRMFRSNSENHEFSVISEGFHEKDTIFREAQTVFKDTVTINSLTPYIYYKIKALDYNFNQSEYSEILKVKRPDKIPPTTPVFKRVLVGKDSITLRFALSNSIDVVEHVVYRKTKLEEPWQELIKLKNKPTFYTDKKVKQGQKYYYSLRSKDDSNLYSEFAVPVFGKPYDDGVRPPIENLSILKEKNKIILNWSYKYINKNTFFVIYKTNKKGNLIQYKNTVILSFIENFNDKKASYAVKVFTKDGGQSKVSKLVKIDSVF